MLKFVHGQVFSFVLGRFLEWNQGLTVSLWNFARNCHTASISPRWTVLAGPVSHSSHPPGCAVLSPWWLMVLNICFHLSTYVFVSPCLCVLRDTVGSRGLGPGLGWLPLQLDCLIWSIRQHPSSERRHTPAAWVGGFATSLFYEVHVC